MTHQSITTTVENIVRSEIMANASHFVSEMCNAGLVIQSCSFIELYSDCMYCFDYSEPPEGYSVSKYSHWESPDLYRWINQNGDTEILFGSAEEAIRDAYNHAGEEPEIIEALEHWIVSDWLAEKLEDIGAPISRDVFGWNIWGRTETGQSLTEDGTLHDVARLTQKSIEEALEKAKAV